MGGLVEGQVRPKKNKTKIIIFVAIVLVVIGFFVWLFWCLSRDPCFIASESECVEYGQEQDRLNPQVNELNFSFLTSPGKLVYPWISTYKREEGSVVLYIEIDRRGGIISNRVVESSGFERLDAAAVDSLSTFKVDVEKLNANEFPYGKNIKLTFKLQ